MSRTKLPYDGRRCRLNKRGARIFTEMKIGRKGTFVRMVTNDKTWGWVLWDGNKTASTVSMVSIDFENA